MDRDARNDEIVRLRRDGLTLREIGRIVKLSRERVRQVLNSRGISGRISPPYELSSMARSLFARGVPIKHIADSEGVYTGRLIKLLVDHGLHKPAPPSVGLSHFSREYIRKWYGKGKSVGEIAADVSRIESREITRNTIIGWAYRNGLSG